MKAVCADVIHTGTSMHTNACLLVDKNRVAGLARGAAAPSSLDYRGEGSILVPGIVDLHVHLRGLQYSYKEDEETGTRAALRGGVVVVVDMPNTRPPLRTRRAVREKLDALEENSLVDYGVYAGIPSSPEELREILEEPVVGFKVYPEDYGNPVLCKTLRAAAEKNLLVIVHPEHPELLGIETGWARNVARPCAAELAAIRTMIAEREKCGKPKLHLTHITCPQSLYLLEGLADRRGISFDVTPHHLLEHVILEQNTCLHDCYCKVNPPLRGRGESFQLLQQLVRLTTQGFQASIASDHAPHTPSEKHAHPTLCPPGISSLDYWPRVLIGFFQSSRLGVDLFTKLASKNPALILGVQSTGVLVEGAEASFTIFRGDCRVALEGYSKSPAYYYFAAPCMEVALVAIRGEAAFTIDDGVLVEPGFGENIALTIPRAD